MQKSLHSGEQNSKPEKSNFGQKLKMRFTEKSGEAAFYEESSHLGSQLVQLYKHEHEVSKFAQFCGLHHAVLISPGGIMHSDWLL